MLRFAIMAPGFILLVGAATAALTDTPAPELNHPAIKYFAPAGDVVAELNAHLLNGSAKLIFESRAGYLKSVLALLNVPVESQIAVFSKTSFQSALIAPKNPRTIFFNDAVMVAWMYGGFIELAAQDPKLGTVFYTLEQSGSARPRFERKDACTRCHHSEETLGVPGLMTRSVYTAPTGNPMLIYGGVFPDHRTPIEQRWGGWYVTGAGPGIHHRGNAVVIDRDTQTVAKLEVTFPAVRYLSTQSDVAALLVFDHQTHMANLITRLGWDARAGRPLADAAREFVDYLLFVDEARFEGRPQGLSGFASKFSSEGPRDAKGRSLRRLNLKDRLFEFPCSYMIYSEAFEGMPQEARAAVYRRMWDVLSGADKARKYARLTSAGRQAVIDIVRATKPEAKTFWASR